MQTLNLPPLYEPIVLQRVDCVVREAARRAREGAPEGTLLWARRVETVSTELARDWRCCPGDLNCALVLRPGFDHRQSLELLQVGNVALLAALAALLVPGMDLQHCWPNAIMLNDGLLGGSTVTFSPQPPASVDWMVLGFAVHLEEAGGRSATSVRSEQGELGFQAATLLEGFSRQFLAWLNRWSDEGFEPVARAWRAHARPQQSYTPASRGHTVEGAVRGLSAGGDLLLETGTGCRETLSLLPALSVDHRHLGPLT